ncbi:AfsR/SARP family transcriptional regulator [Planomonospora venezuelensis]|uniref:DNA-binding SARP family transcriptional activator/tetratricopeptide (TPR) repeat protein/cytidylate kinase n=1 Tax=Planomonospora venezuelensis TaxID=1999 RepID=A0A841D6Q8_PLAVE|nr:BTAD domain-containing putative transcriptional regulator [Planomonospora venezuelensis]MBB5964038.1 DNA-binding SARP family transcriptional activator/tetratricopeptide (TPR) repeat protein/cytidylate kinase [Planomonospora venezuelensis]GIM99660.1 SARP family transcriptional regulator [Planomonospora venezuelensis]
MGVRFTVLGPVEVTADGTRLDGLAPRHRAVLAYLLLHARIVLGRDRLIDAVWGPAPPETARSQIHAAVTAIRRVLRRAGAAEVLQTRDAGYVIVPQAGQLDLDEFTGALSAAEDPQRIRAALALWRGEALADVSADYVADARTRLTERRLAAFERLAELELALGRHEHLIDELSAQAAAHPLREKLACHLMRALHLAGRQPDALAVARAFRARLADDQGLDPGHAFTTLEQAILAGDTAPEPAGQGSFLPYDLPDFAGRGNELGHLTHQAGQAAIYTIDGMAGVGKTAFAVHTAHRLAARYPDGRLFVDLRAHTAGQPPLDPAAALDILLRQAGVPADRIPADLAGRCALWRSELAGRRVLVVLDNAAGAEHVRHLLPGAPGSLTLITSRRRLTDLDGARALSMDVFPAADAIALFNGIVGERAERRPLAVLDVLQLCGFLPLAVRIAAARLHHRPQWTVDYLAERLRAERRRLAELSTAERGVAAAFTLSYRQLAADRRRTFRLLGVHPGRDVDPYAAAALAGTDPYEAEEILEDLLDAHMLIQHEPGRYTFHDLLRDHARSLAEPEEASGALTRLAGHHLRTAVVAIGRLFPYSRHLLPAAPPADGPAPEDPVSALAWLDAERANLIACGVQAAADRPRHTTDLAAALYAYLDGHIHHAEALPLYDAAVRAARDPSAQAQALLNQGVMHARLGDHDRAHLHTPRALDLARLAGDRHAEARALCSLGDVAWEAGDIDRAHADYDRSLSLYREVGERRGEAIVLGNLGLVHSRRNRHDLAHQVLDQALALFHDHGIRAGEATVLGNLGLIHERQGDRVRAADHFIRALALFQDLGYRPGETAMLAHLGRLGPRR